MLEDAPFEASRRLKTIAHLVDAAALAPPARSDRRGAAMIDAHRPSQDGLRRTPTPGASRRTTPSAELSGSESVSSLLPLPPHSATPSQRPGTGDLAVKSPRSLWHYVKALEKESAGSHHPADPPGLCAHSFPQLSPQRLRLP